MGGASGVHVPNEASGTLEADEVDEQYVRLIQVADNAQLRLMLETGVELCGGDAALYVRVDPTCPIYWVRWDNRKSKADLDVVCDLPHRGVRATMLEKVQFNADSTGVVKIRHARNKPSETSTSSSLGALLVSTACGRIVGSKTFRAVRLAVTSRETKKKMKRRTRRIETVAVVILIRGCMKEVGCRRSMCVFLLS